MPNCIVYEHDDTRKHGFSRDAESIALQTYQQYEEAQYDDWICFDTRNARNEFLNIQPNWVFYADAFSYLPYESISGCY